MLAFLVCDDNGLPNWHPSELFSVIEPTLDPTWLFAKDEGNIEGLRAIWGYPEIVSSPSHYDDLLERNDDALKIFYREVDGNRGSQLRI